MECATKPPSKTSSNISDIVSKFAKVCRFRSVGVFSSENPNQIPSTTNVAPGEENSDATDEAEFDGERVHPLPTEIQSNSIECANLGILKLFDTISALKLAYIRLQEAHIPQDPQKIIAADELVVSRLKALCKIKRAYKDKQYKDVGSFSACSALLLAEIEVHERLLEKLKSQVKARGTEIVSLRRELRDMDSKNSKLVEEFREREMKNLKVSNFFLFEDIFEAALKAIHDFAKPLISLMKASGWDLDRAANEIEDSVLYSRRSHKKYAFEAYIAQRMFYGISLMADNTDSLSSFDDPFDVLIKEPDSSFSRFCRTKYLLVVHPKIEASFFGDLVHRTVVSSGVHPRTPFYQAFIKMAWQVWVLQRTAVLTEPRAEIFGVKRGSEFSDFHMECVEELKEEITSFYEGRAKFNVAFMIMPGFRIGEKVVRSRVYLSRIKS